MTSVEPRRDAPAGAATRDARTVARRVAGRTLRVVWPRTPYPLTRRRIARRIRQRLADPAAVHDAEQQMAHVLGGIGRSAEVPAAARAYIAHWAECDELRWHPRRITHQRVEGFEHLADAHRLGRGVVLSFIHHGYFAGAFASVARGGIPVRVVAAALDTPGPRILQHLHVVGSGGGLVSAAGGTAGIVDELTGGAVVAAAVDVPGGSQADFLGRRVRCSSGAAHAATRADAPVVLMTSHRSDAGPVIRLHPAVLPADFDDPRALLAELIRRHEPAVRDWPEATYLPTVCWTPA